MDKQSLEQTKKACARGQKRGLHFIMASVIIWALVAVVHFTKLPIETKNLLTFCCTCPLMPLAWMLACSPVPTGILCSCPLRAAAMTAHSPPRGYSETIGHACSATTGRTTLSGSVSARAASSGGTSDATPASLCVPCVSRRISTLFRYNSHIVHRWRED